MDFHYDSIGNRKTYEELKHLSSTCVVMLNLKREGDGVTSPSVDDSHSTMLGPLLCVVVVQGKYHLCILCLFLLVFVLDSFHHEESS